MKNIVVLGGSFNPPTKAHHALLRKAIDALHAELGIFVPSSASYVARKNQRSSGQRMNLSEQLRKELLESMCDPDMAVDTCEFGDLSRGRTLATLRKIQADHPDSTVWFIMGADKMRVFTRWPSCDEIRKHFGIIWVERENTALNAPKGRSFILHADEATAGISSSAFWAALPQNKETAFRLLCPAAAQKLAAAMKTK